MKKLKLWIFVVLAAMMLLPQGVWADVSGTCGENLNWIYVESSKTLTIKGTGEMNNYSNDINNMCPWRNFEIITAIISPGVTSIGNYAFYGCSNISSTTIPNSVTILYCYFVVSLNLCTFKHR